jgi:hypothetical protein
MAKNAIYVFRDIRYSDSVKVGHGDPNDLNKRAQGHSPEGMECVATWDVIQRAKDLEREIHQYLRKIFGQLEYPNCGEEWFWVPADKVVVEIEKFFIENNKKYERADNVEANCRNKDFMQSEPSLGRNGKATYPGRLVLWLMEEFQTERLKLYQCSEWFSPNQRIRTYSRNGFFPISFVTYRELISLSNNDRINRIRKETISNICAPIGREKYGWLIDGTKAEDVVEAVAELSCEFLDDWSIFAQSANGKRPRGIRTDKEITSISKHEIDCFDPNCPWARDIISRIK